MPSDLVKLVMRELFDKPSKLYGFSKVAPPEGIPVPPVWSAPLSYLSHDELPPFHWVIADLGHGTLAQE